MYFFQKNENIENKIEVKEVCDTVKYNTIQVGLALLEEYTKSFITKSDTLDVEAFNKFDVYFQKRMRISTEKLIEKMMKFGVYVLSLPQYRIHYNEFESIYLEYRLKRLDIYSNVDNLRNELNRLKKLFPKPYTKGYCNEHNQTIEKELSVASALIHKLENKTKMLSESEQAENWHMDEMASINAYNDFKIREKAKMNNTCKCCNCCCKK